MSQRNGSILRHGSAEAKVIGSPTIGKRFETPLLSIHQFPEQPYEVNFTSEEDVVTISFGLCTGLKAYDSDKRSALFETAGTSYFHPAGSEIYVLAEQSSELLCFSFPRHIRQEILQDHKPSVYGDLTRTIEDIESHFTAALAPIIRDHISTGEAPSALEGEALALTFYEHLLRTVAPVASTATRPGLDVRRLQRVLEFIEANLDQNLSLLELSQVAALQLNHFVRAFKQATRKTPHQYVLHRRLARARQLLRHSSFSYVEVAYAAGFSSQAHLTSTFAKHVGLTPALYRRQARLR